MPPDIIFASAPQCDPAEVARLAANLARNSGWHCFPCRDDKRPATPHGFKDATNDPAAVLDLWRQHPAALIGVATGAASGINVLDLDAKHDEACAWWTQNRHRIPATRRYRTRSGGMHCLFQHHARLSNTQSRIAPGIDTRAGGGYVVYWPAAGLPYLDHAPIATWPGWLLRALAPPIAKAKAERAPTPDAAIDGLLRTVRGAKEGERNARLFWAANRLRERGTSRAEAERLLIPSATGAGLPDAEARRTVKSAWGEK